MVRAAVLASGEGSQLQAVLDAMYFKEIPNIELVAVICPQRDAYAMKRALNAGIPAYVVDPELFPTTPWRSPTSSRIWTLSLSFSRATVAPSA